MGEEDLFSKGRGQTRILHKIKGLFFLIQNWSLGIKFAKYSKAQGILARRLRQPGRGYEPMVTSEGMQFTIFERKGVSGMSNWHSKELDEVLKELNTNSYQGLSVEEARSRLEKYGYNELKQGGQFVSPSTRFISQLKNILIILLLIAAVLSVVGPPILGISMRACLMSWYGVIAQAM
jgi:magnesium-transporting ATPase (P-type)